MVQIVVGHGVILAHDPRQGMVAGWILTGSSGPVNVEFEPAVPAAGGRSTDENHVVAKTPGQVCEPLKIDRGLLEHLRQVTGDSALRYKSPPKSIGGGFSGAKLYGFELSSPPADLAGPVVLRMSVGRDATSRQRREAALQDAAGRLGCAVPRIRLTGAATVGLGGPFFIMDRVAGIPLSRWGRVSTGLAALVAIALGHVWPLLLAFFLSSAVVGIAIGIHQHRLHRLRLEDVKRIYGEHGLEDADVGIAYWLEIAADAIDAEKLEGYRPGLQWLRDNRIVPTRPKLCHGDIQPRNFMAGWTRVTGIIDWELACVADPELDVAVLRCDVILLPGPWLAPLYFPMYWSYLAYLLTKTRFDPQRLRYYEALRTLFILTSATRHYLTTLRLKADDVDDRPGPDIPPFWMRMLTRAHVRRFRKLTDVRLTPPNTVIPTNG